MKSYSCKFCIMQGIHALGSHQNRMDMLLSTQTDKTTAQRYTQKQQQQQQQNNPLLLLLQGQKPPSTIRILIRSFLLYLVEEYLYIFKKKVYDHSLTIAACRQHCSEQENTPHFSSQFINKLAHKANIKLNYITILFLTYILSLHVIVLFELLLRLTLLASYIQHNTSIFLNAKLNQGNIFWQYKHDCKCISQQK